MVAYLSGSFGEGGGTTFLEINNVGKVLDAGSKYSLPTFKGINKIKQERCCKVGKTLFATSFSYI